MVPPIAAQVFIYVPSRALRSNRLKYRTTKSKIAHTQHIAVILTAFDERQRRTNGVAHFQRTPCSRPIKAANVEIVFRVFSFRSQTCNMLSAPAVFEYLTSTFGSPPVRLA